jgi:hypothetical protein
MHGPPCSLSLVLFLGVFAYSLKWPALSVQKRSITSPSQQNARSIRSTEKLSEILAGKSSARLPNSANFSALRARVFLE